MAALLVAACGGGGGSQPEVTPRVMPLDFAIAGMAVIKVRSSSDGVTLLEEKLTSLLESGPQRSITLLDNGGAVRGRYSAPPGFSLIDFAQHPSGEISVALATARTVTLSRLDRFGSAGNEFPLLDAQAPNDPFYDAGGVHDDASMLPVFTRDAVRLAAIGENVAVALRTGRNAVVAYRFDFARPGGYVRTWRTLVEPGLSMFGIGITSGTFDTFGQLENHFHVHVDADAAGNVAVAVVGKPALAAIFPAHADYFRQPTGIQSGVLVSRLGPDGQRLGTTLIDSIQLSELHGLRLYGDDITVVGRVFSERRDDGTGWDAYVARVDRVSGALLFFRVVDVDRGELLFDIAPLAQGRFLVAGTAGYTQNPVGASVSEQATPLLAVLESDGTLRQRVDLSAGVRQNQLRSIVARGGNWLLGALVNGPGTHSGDANPQLITADGFVREMAIAAP
ncbi:MAG: hypothetical protein ACXWHC_15080 [Usitatibacter sp.]